MAKPFLTETTEAIQQVFLGVDLLSAQNVTLTIIACVLMYANVKMMSAIKPVTTPNIPGANVPDMAKVMTYMHGFMVLMIGLFVYNVASGVGLYIITTTMFSVGQFVYQQRALLKAKILAWKNK